MNDPDRPFALANRRRLTLAALLALAVAGFVALGVWQVQRLAWKTALIARVNARVHAAPVPAPGPADWPGLPRDGDEYLRVQVRGRFLGGKETPVQAVTDLGAGFWILTPLKTDAGFTVLVNRGFVPPDLKRPGDRRPEPDGEQSVVGLLRISEPHGGFLRANDPAHDLWRSRDVAAIAAKRGLGTVAPYFIDAEAATPERGWPRGGLTVIRFPNSHLVYAMTWFALALGSAFSLAVVLSRRPDGMGG